MNQKHNDCFALYEKSNFRLSDSNDVFLTTVVRGFQNIF